VDDELLRDYLAESSKHLATIETDLLAMEQAGAAIDEELVNRVFRAAHFVQGGSRLFRPRENPGAADKTENILDMIRSRRMAPTPDIENRPGS